MCGRYTVFTETDEREMLEIMAAAEEKYGKNSFKTGEVFPTENALLLTTPYFRRPEILKWGYDNPRGKGILINARAENVASSRLFSPDFAARRCIVPSTGFFEWNPDKARFLFNAEGSGMVYMAGIYNAEHRFVILTVPANDSMKEVHHRMPLILSRGMLRNWLCDTEEANTMLLRTPQPLIRREA